MDAANPDDVSVEVDALIMRETLTPMRLYSTAHTGPNTKLGGLIFGLGMRSNHEPFLVPRITMGVPVAPPIRWARE